MINFSEIIPKFLLEDDEFIKQTSEIVNKYLNNFKEKVKYLSFMENLDKLDDETLDKFATDRGIFWYDSLLPIERKRDLIRSYKLTFKKLGTKYAVQQLIKDYFGSAGTIEEWYEYGGEHHRFKVIVRSNGIPSSFINRFIDALYWVKSTDTWLDYIKFIQELQNDTFISFSTINHFKSVRIEPNIEIEELEGKINIATIVFKQKEVRRI